MYYFPQGGSGKANRGRSLRISPGDTVLGFFLDGDDAQLPMIMGLFANTSSDYNFGSLDGYTVPFSAFTGYTKNIKPNDYILKNESGDSSGDTVQISPRQTDQNLADKIKEKTKKAEVSASVAINKVITFGGNNQNRIAKVKSEIENAVNEVAYSSAKDKFRIIDNTSRKISGIAQSLSGSFLNKTFKDLAPKLNQGLHDLYKDVYGKILLATQNGAIAKKAANLAQTAMVGPVRALQNFLPCAAKNITDNLFGSIRNILTSFLDNVKNFTDCIGDQFVGAIFNDIIGKINDQLGGLMKGVSKIFDGDLVGMLRSKAEGILGIANAFNCDLPIADLGSKTNQWILGKGPKGSKTFNLESVAETILATANAAQSLQEAAASPGGIIGNLGIFDFMRPDVSTPGFSSQLSDCYTGPPLNCSGIQVNIFGGGGEGATGKALLGAIVGDTFAEQTGSLLGIKMTNGGSGYRTPPFVEIVDNCDQGFGAVARAVVDYDPKSPTYQQVTDIYVVSPGEFYPIIEPDDSGDYTVDHVVVVNPGEDYTQDDVITDDKGNVYEKFLDESGRILNVIPPNPETTNVESVTELPELTIESETGFGAILKAQISPRPEYQGEIKQIIDCVSPRDGIVGYVNGEPYYGPFHVMPNGIKMTGVKHSDNDMIIYDTPQQSRTSTVTRTSSPETMVTVSSPAPVLTQGPTGSSVPTSTPSSPMGPSSPPASPPSSPPASPPASPPSSPPASPPSSPPSGGYGY